jgi:hypothetical protein
VPARKRFVAGRACARVQRRDLVLALVGALLVAGATAYAALSGGGPAPAPSYVVVPVALALPPPFPTTPAPVGLAYDVASSVGLPANASALRVAVWINATPAFGPGATARLAATLPDGSTREATARAGPGDAALTLALDLALATPPANGTAPGAGAPAAKVNLTLDFAPGPSPLPGGAPYQLESRASLTTWTLVAVPPAGPK